MSLSVPGAPFDAPIPRHPLATATFVAAYRRRLLARARESTGPLAESHYAALLHIDIVGFTAMTDRLVDEGMWGGERMAAAINDYFGGLERIATARGGEIVFLAGDAARIVWLGASEPRLADAVMLAIHTALTAITGIDASSLAGTTIQLRASVGAGVVEHIEIGGGGNVWDGILTGDAAAQITAADRLSEPGSLVLSRQAAAYANGRFVGTPLIDGHVRVASAVGPPPIATSPPNDDEVAVEIMSAAVPPCLFDRLAHGLPIQGFGEFRTVTTLFARLADGLDAARLQAAASTVRGVCDPLGGTTYQILVDEKGAAFVVVFGLPPLAHEDDAGRAIQAALTLRTTFDEHGVAHGIGVATGRIFCTVYGSGTRHHFAIVGPAINLAARLSEARRGLLCDAATIEAAETHHRIERAASPPMGLKGKREPIVAYSPTLCVRRRMPETAGATKPVGRDAEQARLDEAIHALAAGRGGLIVLEGEAGIGKSTLAADLLRSAAAAGLRTLAGFGDSVESRTPYFPWRAVCRAALGIHPAATSLTTESRHDLEQILGETAPLLPLLDAVLAVGLRDTPDTEALTGEARAESLRRVLLRTLPAALGHAPALLLLEDAHWFDTASALLLEQFVESRPPVLVVLTCRPGDDLLEPFARMRLLDNCLTLTLGGLSASHCGSIVAHRIGADRVDADVVDLVLARTRGNPLFVVTLVDLLMNAGILSVVDRVGTIAGTTAIAEADLDAVLRKQGVPSTLEGIMLARLDRLDAGARRALQCASVLGHAFSCRDLQAAGELTAAVTNAAVGRLVAAGLLVPAPASDSADYEFAHAVVHDVTYHAMAFGDRRRLHRLVANRLATSTLGRAGALDVVLAHHFAEAGEHEFAIPYFCSAGERALSTYSNLEAVHLLSRALTVSGIDVTSAVPGPRLSETTAGLLLCLARAEMRLGRYADTQRHAASGLAGIGLALPTRRFGAVAGILTEAGRQTAHRWLRRRVRRLDGEQRQRLAGACSSLEDLVEANFFSGQALPAIYCALKALNLAERGGPSAELARSYATVAGIASVTPASFIARVYRQRALDTLAGLDNPPATVWVSIVIALSLVGSGQWTSAERLLEKARDVADRIGDRRRWRDAVENLAGIAACRADWRSALEGVSAMQASAERDKDRRALVSAWRERGFYSLHSGQLDSVLDSVSRISAELGRGLVAEEAAARHDMLSLSAAVSLERGDENAALAMAGEAVAIMQKSDAPTFPFNYWAAFAATQVFLQLLDRGGPSGRSTMDLDRLTRAGCAVLAREARVHAIASPALLLCRGRYAGLKKRSGRSRRLLRRCIERAATLHMPFELAAAEHELARVNGHREEIASRT